MITGSRKIAPQVNITLSPSNRVGGALRCLSLLAFAEQDFVEISCSSVGLESVTKRRVRAAKVRSGTHPCCYDILLRMPAGWFSRQRCQTPSSWTDSLSASSAPSRSGLRRVCRSTHLIHSNGSQRVQKELRRRSSLSRLGGLSTSSDDHDPSNLLAAGRDVDGMRALGTRAN